MSHQNKENISICDGFTSNTWMPDLCVHCQKHKTEHEVQPDIRDKLHIDTTSDHTEALQQPKDTCKTIERPKDPPPVGVQTNIVKPQKSPRSVANQRVTRPTEPPPPPLTDKKNSSQLPAPPKPSRTPSHKAIGQAKLTAYKAKSTSAPPATPSTKSNPSPDLKTKETQTKKSQSSSSLSEKQNSKLTESIQRPLPVQKPTPAAKPRITVQRHSSLRTETPLKGGNSNDNIKRTSSLRDRRPVKKVVLHPKADTSVLNRVSAYQQACISEDMSEQGKEVVREKQSRVQFTEPSQTGDDEMQESSVDKEITFRNTLHNLGVDVNKLHSEEYDALYDSFSFQEYEGYHEQLHEGSFHSHVRKIRASHARHVSASPTKSSSPTKSIATEREENSESFYGSVDVTKPMTGGRCDYDSPQHMLVKTDDVGGAYDNASPRDMSSYDNSTQPIAQYQDIPDIEPKRSSGYGNIHSSPKYDAVPMRMTESQESGQSERIYAEVGPPTTSPGSSNSNSPSKELKKKSKAPAPPSSNQQVPPVSVMALQFNSKQSYMVNSFPSELAQQGKAGRVGPISPAGVAGHRSRQENKTGIKMPTNKFALIKNLLKIGGKRETSQGDLQPEEIADDHRVKLPKAFLDAWVDQSAQPIDETDPALQGVWPYDKSSSFNRASDKPSMTMVNSAPKENYVSKGFGSTGKSKQEWAKNGRSASSNLFDNPQQSTTMRKPLPKQTSTPDHSMTTKRPAKKPPPPPLGGTQGRSHSDVEGTMPRNKLREHFLRGSMDTIKPAPRSAESNGASGLTTLKKQRTKTDPDIHYDQPWGDADAIVNSILKNGGGDRRHKNGSQNSSSQSSTKSGGSAPMVTVHAPPTEVKKKPPALHSRNRSTPSLVAPSTYSSEGNSNPHDSGYESATMRSVKKAPRSSSSDRRGSNPSIHSGGKSPSPPSRVSAVDSVPICFDQVAAMNVSTMQELCAMYMTAHGEQTIPVCITEWDEIVIENETEPAHANNKCVFYRAHCKHEPEKQFTVMISLKKPTTCDIYAPNLLPVRNCFEAHVPPHLIPARMIASYKGAGSIRPSHSAECKVAEVKPTARAKSEPLLSKPAEKQDDADSGLCVDVKELRDSVFSTQQSTDSNNSMCDDLDEEAAAESILKAVAGEDNSDTFNDDSEGDSLEPVIETEIVVSKKQSKTAIERATVVQPLEEVIEPAVIVSRKKSNDPVIERDIVVARKNKTTPDTAVDKRKTNLDKNMNNLKGVRERALLNLNCNNNNESDDEEESTAEASKRVSPEGGQYDQPWHGIQEKASKTLEASYKAGLLRGDKAKQLMTEHVLCNVTILPKYHKMESIQSHIKRLDEEGREFAEFEMDIFYVLYQILNIIFALAERQLVLEAINASDFIVCTDADGIPTILCHMLSVRHSASPKYQLTCEKLRMFLIQISHISDSLKKSDMFLTVDDMIQSANDAGDLRTISTILQYILWGPKEEEVKIITLAEHRRQAFELWLQLARAKLVNRMAFHPMDKLKIYHIFKFLAGTSGTELFKITKMLSAY